MICEHIRTVSKPEDLNITPKPITNFLNIDLKKFSYPITDITSLKNFLNSCIKLNDLLKINLTIPNYDLNKEILDTIVYFLKESSTNLKEVNIDLDNTSLSQSEYESILFSLSDRLELKRISISIQSLSIKFDISNIINQIELLLKTLPNLNNSFINIQNNKVSYEECKNLRSIMKHIPFNELLV